MRFPSFEISLPPAVRWATLAAVIGAVGPSGRVFAYDLNGFMPESGRGDLSISHTFESYDEFWMGKTQVSDPGVGRVETGSLSLWAQWGLAERAALIASLAYVDVNSDGLGGFSAQGLQDRALLLKLQLAQLKKGAASHRLVCALGLRSPASGYEPNLPVDLGDGTTDGLFRLIYLLTFESMFVSQQAGYDVRGEDAPNGVPLFSEIGVTVRDWTISGFYSGYVSDGGTDIGDPGFTFPSNGDDYHRIGGKIFARLGKDFGISASAFRTVDGRNVGETTAISTGLTLGL